jgi:LDH2 family malate/lactate/ureidoglycolate dehydrogenase
MKLSKTETMTSRERVRRAINHEPAVENHLGDNGPGEVCCSFIMEKGKRLADRYGIGLCTISDSNHYLASAPYTEKAAEEGYLSLLFTRGHR